jgi:hypothetical protein
MRRRRRRKRKKRKEGRRQCTQNFTGVESGQVAGIVSDVEVWVLLPEICLINKVNFWDMAVILMALLSGVLQVMNITS